MTLRLSLCLAVGLAAVGCKPKHPYVWANDLPRTQTPVEAVPLRPGDQIIVQVPRMEEIQGTEPFTVNADGSLVLPLVGVVEVEGLTVEQVTQRINQRLKGIIVNPDARVSVVNPRVPVVTVLGEVREPGRFEIQLNEGVLPVLALAGGLTEFADPDDIFVVRKYPKRLRIRFRYDDLVGGVERSLEFELRDGDVIIVE